MRRASRVASVLLVLTVAAFGLFMSEGRRVASPRLIAGDGGPTAGPFTIAGSVAGLYPGAVKPLSINVTNPNTYALAITSLSATVGDANAACTGGNVVIAPWSGATLVPAGATATFALTAQMVASPPDACQGANFPLTYLGEGVRAPLPTQLNAAPVLLNVERVQVNIGTLRAVLRVTGTTEGIGGKTLVFYTNNGELCRAVTKPDGQATCSGVPLTLNALTQLQYKVRFLGDAIYEPSLAIAALVKLP